MPPLSFMIDPAHVREALEQGALLHVSIHGDRYQYRRVTVVPKK